MTFQAIPFEQWLQLRETVATQAPATGATQGNGGATFAASGPQTGMTPELWAKRDQVRWNMMKKNVKTGNLDPYVGKKPERNDYNYDYEGDEDHIFGHDSQHLGMKPSSYDKTQELPPSRSTQGMRK